MKYSLNLASGTYINHRRIYAVFSVLSLFLLGLLIVNSITLVRDSNRTRQVELRLDELRQQKQDARQQGEISAAAIEQMAQRIETANELLLRDNYRWTKLLDHLETHLPDGISIRNLQPDFKTGVLKLSGVAVSIADLRNFIDILSRSEVFTDVYLKDQRMERTTDEMSGGISFSIELRKRSGDET